MPYGPFGAGDTPGSPAFPILYHINLRIRKPMLYPLSYEGANLRA